MNQVASTNGQTAQPLKNVCVCVWFEPGCSSNFYNSQNIGNPNVHKQKNGQKNCHVHPIKYYTAIKG